MKVYLAHGRDNVATVIRGYFELGFTLYDPMTESPQHGINEFVKADLNAIRDSDLLLAYHDYHQYGGLAVEAGFAYALGKPVIYVCKQTRVDSMIAGISDAVFVDLFEALKYIEKRYGIELC